MEAVPRRLQVGAAGRGPPGVARGGFRRLCLGPVDWGMNIEGSRFSLDAADFANLDYETSKVRVPEYCHEFSREVVIIFASVLRIQARNWNDMNHTSQY